MGNIKKLITNKGTIISNLIIIGLIVWILTKLPKIIYIFVPLEIIFKAIVVPILVAYILYLLLNPLVLKLEKHHISRALSATIIILTLILSIVLLLFFGMPIVIHQTSMLLKDLPKAINHIISLLHKYLPYSLVSSIDVNLKSSISSLHKFVDNNGTQYNDYELLVKALTTTTNIILSIAMIPFILFYMLKDSTKKIRENVIKYTPYKLQQTARELIDESSEQISGYVNGQIKVSFIIGLMLFFSYCVIGMPYSIPLALFAMITSVAPYIGPAIAISPAIFVSVSDPNLLTKLLIVWGLTHLLEGKFVTPIIMGNTLKIHPVTIILVIVSSGHLFGVLGLIFAVPGYSILKVVVSHIFKFIQQATSLYEDKLQKKSDNLPQ